MAAVYFIGKRVDFNSLSLSKLKVKLQEEKFDIIDFLSASADSPTDDKHDEWLNKADFVTVFMSNKWFIGKEQSDIFQEIAHLLDSEKGKFLLDNKRVYWFSLDDDLDLGKIRDEVKKHWKKTKNSYIQIDNKEDVPSSNTEIEAWVKKTYENIKSKIPTSIDDFQLDENLQSILCTSIMTANVFTVYPTDVLSTVDRIAYENIRHFPVVRDETVENKVEKLLLGIFSRRDAVKQSPLSEVKNAAIKLGKSDKLMSIPDVNISKKGYTHKKDNSYFYEITENDDILEAIYYLKDPQPVSGYAGQRRMISALPVIDENTAYLRGIITYIDILKNIQLIAGARFNEISNVRVDTVMKTNVEKLTENDRLEKAHSIVKNQGVRTIVIVADNLSKVKGLLTDYELYKNYVEDFTGDVPVKFVMSKLVNDFNKPTPLLNELKITTSNTIGDLIKKLEKRENRAFTSLPVIGNQFELLGVIGYVDILRLLFDTIKPQ
jgi:CBS domain-containing protein